MSREVSVDIHGAVKHTKDVDGLVSLDQVRDPIVAVLENADLAGWQRFVAMPHLREVAQYLNFAIDALYYTASGRWVILGNVVVDAL